MEGITASRNGTTARVTDQIPIFTEAEKAVFAQWVRSLGDRLRAAQQRITRLLDTEPHMESQELLDRVDRLTRRPQ